MQKQPVSTLSAENSAPGFYRDLDELNHAISGADIEVIQLKPGALEAHAHNYDINELSIDRGSTNRTLRVRGSLDAKRYALGMYRSGASAKFNGISVDPSRLLFYLPGQELDGHLNDSFAWTSLIIPASWIESISLAARNSSFLNFRTGCDNLLPDPDKLQDLWTAVDTIIASRSRPDQCDEGEMLLSLDVQNALGAALSDFDAPTCKVVSRTLSHYRTAQRAERYMRERISEKLCIDDICATLGISRRYLEYAFVDAFGTSPSRYFRVLRLHQVRRKLRNPGIATTVTRVALGHGFDHLGLFSTQYRTLFGESPSSTLNGQVSF